MSYELPAQVDAVNAAHQYAAGLAPQLREIFRPLVGQKVVKTTNNSLTEKVKRLLPDLPHDHTLCVYPSITAYSLAFIVKTGRPANDAGRYVYHETAVSIGSLRDGKLAELSPVVLYRCDYTVDEIETNRHQYAEALHAVNALRQALYPFDVA